jgi:hypothetical protein
LKIVSLDLQVEYVYLDVEERTRFAQNPGEYLIEQVQFTGEESITQASNQTRMSFNHPIKSLYWALKMGKYSSDMESRFLTYNPHSSDDMVLTATRRFALRCSKYLNAECSQLVKTLGDNKLVPLPSLNSTQLTLYNLIDARIINENSVDLDNV